MNSHAQPISFYVLLLLLISGNLNAQGLVVDSFAIQSGQEICIPVKVENFDNICGFQLALHWDSLLLELKTVQNIALTNLSVADFTTIPPNRLNVYWTDAVGVGVTQPDGKILFKLCFLALSNANFGAHVVIDSVQILDCFGQNVGVSSEMPEAFNLEVLRMHLIPNPTSSSAQLVFQSLQKSDGMIVISNAMGSSVLSQSIVINAGENSFEIPAKALNTKGIYQVTIQTDKGISSQILSVQ